MNRITLLFFFVLALPLSGCRIDGETVRLMTTSGSLKISAEIEPQPKELRDKQLAYYGHVTVTNASEASATFGNSCLVLAIAPEQSSRAYMDTVASVNIDFTLVEIGPGESLSEHVYWVFKTIPSAPEVGLSYTCGVLK